MPRLAIIVALVLASATAASAQAPKGPYFTDLRRLCPAKHLERLSPAELNGALESFTAKLSRIQRHQIREQEQTRCRKSPGGLSCPNAADLRALARLGLTHRLAERVCSTHKSCRGPSDCR